MKMYMYMKKDTAIQISLLFFQWNFYTCVILILLSGTICKLYAWTNYTMYTEQCQWMLGFNTLCMLSDENMTIR